MCDVAKRRRHVKDALAALGGPAHVGRMRELPFDELDACIDESAVVLAGANERPHAVTLGGECASEMPARESRSTGYEYVHVAP
jgi:hypothetical protein